MCMIRERYVILKAALHPKLCSCLAAASYSVHNYAVLPSIYVVTIFYGSLENLAILSLIPKRLHCTYSTS